jgi:hypothetical protein
MIWMGVPFIMVWFSVPVIVAGFFFLALSGAQATCLTVRMSRPSTGRV